MNSLHLSTRFAVFLLGLFLMAASAPAQVPGPVYKPDQRPWPADARNYQFYLIGNSHIDPVWLWPWQEGLSLVHSTFREALERMKDTPGIMFTASSAQFYDWVAQNDPAMIPQIRKRIEEGRWGLVGGWWVEPDMNIPSGESMARQGLYSQLLFRKLFGRIATTGYNPDSFGHAGTLPQIYKLEGMQNYVMMRPQENEKTLPADLFWWKGPDGTRMLTYRIPISYVDVDPIGRRLRQIVTRDNEPTHTLMYFFGMGDHGGGATKANILSIEEIQKQEGAPKIQYSTPDHYFAEIRKQIAAGLQLPTVDTDLQHHSVGCYTAESTIKKNNRTAEAALTTAEKIAAMSATVTGGEYPQSELTSAWKKVMFNQFHDIMAGTAIPEYYRIADDAYGYAKEVADQATYLAAQRIAWQVPATNAQSDYLVVFNPHAWQVTAPVEYDFDYPIRRADWSLPNDMNSVVEDEKGNELPHQWTQASSMNGRRTKVVFLATLPAFGYRQFRIWHPETPHPVAQGVKASEQGMENQHLRVTFLPQGGISIFDKDANREVFTNAGGARALVINDPSDTWSHGVREYADVIGEFGKPQVKVLENGPMRAKVQVRTTYGQSWLQTDWVLYTGSRNLEADVKLDWHEHQKMVKFSFPVDITAPRATYEVPYGHIVRDTDNLENPGQRWVDVSNTSAPEYGLAVINNAKYGYSVKGSDLRLSVVRSPVYAHHDPKKLLPGAEYQWQDQGEQTFRMLLVPHAGSWQQTGLVRMAEQFVDPVPVVYQGIHPGARAQADSFLSVDAPNVVVAAVKKAESNGDWIVRCYETNGQPANATIELKMLKNRWTGTFRPNEIKTLRFPAGGGAAREVDLLEE